MDFEVIHQKWDEHIFFRRHLEQIRAALGINMEIL